MSKVKSREESRVLFLTFGQDTNFLNGLEAAAKRLEYQALASKQFTDVIRLDFNSIKLLPNFELIEPILSSENWGFGYFVWKPFILNWALTELGPLYDYVIYADAGCELQSNPTKIRHFHRLLRELETQPCLAYFTELPEILMTKSNVLTILENESDKFRGSIEATYILFKSDSGAQLFVREWLRICTKDNFESLMPVQNESDGTVKLQLHCYDQSIFSVIYKNHFKRFLTPIRPKVLKNGKIGMLEEFIYGSNFIWPIRNRSAQTRLNKLLNISAISELSVCLFRVYRIVRRAKQKIDPRSRENKILQLLIPYREAGFISER